MKKQILSPFHIFWEWRCLEDINLRVERCDRIHNKNYTFNLKLCKAFFNENYVGFDIIEDGDDFNTTLHKQKTCYNYSLCQTKNSTHLLKRKLH